MKLYELPDHLEDFGYPGRWVPWCVEHDSDDFHTNMTGLTGCNWHPQGAFIPAVEDVLPAVDVDDPVREALLDLRRRHRGVIPEEDA